MDDVRRLEDRIEILEDVIHFVSEELRQMPGGSRKADEKTLRLLFDIYDVLDRHGYKGIVKLVGDMDPECREDDAGGWAHDSSGDFYFFKK
jgi:hypothetical protein